MRLLPGLEKVKQSDRLLSINKFQFLLRRYDQKFIGCAAKWTCKIANLKTATEWMQFPSTYGATITLSEPKRSLSGAHPYPKGFRISGKDWAYGGFDLNVRQRLHAKRRRPWIITPVSCENGRERVVFCTYINIYYYSITFALIRRDIISHEFCVQPAANRRNAFSDVIQRGSVRNWELYGVFRCWSPYYLRSRLCIWTLLLYAIRRFEHDVECNHSKSFHSITPSPRPSVHVNVATYIVF
jgi:hypothetical protein